MGVNPNWLFNDSQSGKSGGGNENGTGKLYGNVAFGIGRFQNGKGTGLIATERRMGDKDTNNDV